MAFHTKSVPALRLHKFGLFAQLSLLRHDTSIRFDEKFSHRRKVADGEFAKIDSATHPIARVKIDLFLSQLVDN